MERKGRGGEQRKSPETLAGLAGRQEGRETSGWFMLSVWLNMKGHSANADMPSLFIHSLVSCTA